MIRQVPPAVLGQYRDFISAKSQRLDAGLINDTFIVEGTRSNAIFQRLHPIFDKEVNLDIAAVTRRLVERGLQSPCLLSTDAGNLWVEHAGRVWRALSFIPGRTHHKVAHTGMAYEAGALVARFHGALQDLRHVYHCGRGTIHDTPRHLARLEEALTEHTEHSLHREVAELAARLFRHSAPLDTDGALPLRHCHGDLKISNIVFDQAGRAICLIDLDTVCLMQWHLEMGDALRSWCNPGTEEDFSSRFDLNLLDAALAGYASEKPAFVTVAERETLLAGLLRICLELSARFLTDALNEQYFGWDATRYRSRGAHNLQRARAMLQLHESVHAQRGAAESIVRKHLE